jgi:paraquat-inducible protein B
MSQKPNYFKIGLFVIAGTLVLAIAIIIFGGGKYFEETYILETYFEQSVQGLDVGAPIKFQGVQVGNISEIGFVFEDYKTSYQYVLVRSKIIKRTRKNSTFSLFIDDNDRELGMKKMIEKGLRLQLASQGITGVAFLNAVYLDPEKHPPLSIDWKPKYLYVPSAQGTIEQITQSIEKLTDSIGNIDFKDISDDVEKLLTTLNLTVQEADIPKLSKKLQSTLETLDKTVAGAGKTINSKEVKQTLTNVAETTEEFRNALKRTARLLESREDNLTITLKNIQRISEELSEFIGTVKKYPSWVLFGDPPPHFGHEKKEEDKN